MKPGAATGLYVGAIAVDRVRTHAVTLVQAFKARLSYAERMEIVCGALPSQDASSEVPELACVTREPAALSHPGSARGACHHSWDRKTAGHPTALSGRYRSEIDTYCRQYCQQCVRITWCGPVRAELLPCHQVH